ncbi:MAG: mechanosensitive ion channel family protein [Anaerolineae bacterium]
MNELDDLLGTGHGGLESLGLPALGHFAIAMAVVLLAALLVHFITDRVLMRLASRTSLALDDELLSIAHRPLTATVLLLGTVRATELLDVAPALVTVTQRCLYTALSIVLARAVALLLQLFIEDYVDQVADVTGLRSEMAPFLRNVVNIAVLAVWAASVLSIWGMSVAPIVASAGVAGLAVSLAAKDALANIFGGISIFLEGTYAVGDYLELPDVRDIGRGEVVAIGLRSTRLATRDGIVVTIPNALMANSAIVNQSAQAQYRARIGFGVAYGTDLERVEEIVLRLANAHPLVLPSPDPRLRLRGLADSAVQYELLCWCADPAQRGLLMHDLYTQIHDDFAAARIEIPFPQLDVRFPGAEE